MRKKSIFEYKNRNKYKDKGLRNKKDYKPYN